MKINEWWCLQLQNAQEEKLAPNGSSTNKIFYEYLIRNNFDVPVALRKTKKFMKECTTYEAHVWGGYCCCC